MCCADCYLFVMLHLQSLQFTPLRSLSLTLVLGLMELKHTKYCYKPNPQFSFQRALKGLICQVVDVLTN